MQTPVGAPQLARASMTHSSRQAPTTVGIQYAQGTKETQHQQYELPEQYQHQPQPPTMLEPHEGVQAIPFNQQQQQEQEEQYTQQSHLQSEGLIGLIGGWQSDEDYQDRKTMIGNIVRLMQQRRPNAPHEWVKKLPQMAKKLEEALYRSARSFEEYIETDTLVDRLTRQAQYQRYQPECQDLPRQQQESTIHPKQGSQGNTCSQPEQERGQQQQHHLFPLQRRNEGWQSNNDYHHRRKMIARIAHLLQRQKPDAPGEWLRKLPQVAKRLEESLYWSAGCLEEYNDENSLEQRLSRHALNQHSQSEQHHHDQQQTTTQTQRGTLGNADNREQRRQQQRHRFLHIGRNGRGQEKKDYQERRKMIAKIVLLVQYRKQNLPQRWVKKLPQVAKWLEESLYRSAKSFEEYKDASTLKQRLRQLAIDVTRKTNRSQGPRTVLKQQDLRAHGAQETVDNRIFSTRQTPPPKKSPEKNSPPTMSPQSHPEGPPGQASPGSQPVSQMDVEGDQRVPHNSKAAPVLGQRRQRQQQPQCSPPTDATKTADYFLSNAAYTEDFYLDFEED